MRVPIDGKIAWIRNDGEFSYLPGHIETIQYQFGTTETVLENPPERDPNGGEQWMSVLQSYDARTSGNLRKTCPKIQPSETNVPGSVLARRSNVVRP